MKAVSALSAYYLLIWLNSTKILKVIFWKSWKSHFIYWLTVVVDIWQKRMFATYKTCLYYISMRGFFSRTLTVHWTAAKWRGSYLFLYANSTRSRLFRHLFTVLELRLIPLFLFAAHIIIRFLLDEIYSTLGVSIWMNVNGILFVHVLLDAIDFSQTNGEYELSSLE